MWHINAHHSGCPDFAVAYFVREIAKRDWKKASLGQAVGITLQTFLRHEMTDYDTLLLSGMDLDEARRCLQPRINKMIGSWRPKRKTNEKRRQAMIKIEARMTLVGVFWELCLAHELEAEDFLRKARSFTPYGLYRFLNGHARLHPDQLVEMLEILPAREPYERRMLVLCLAQFYGIELIELLERHLRPAKCNCGCEEATSSILDQIRRISPAFRTL